MKKKMFVFLSNGFSDLGIAYLTPEIKKSIEFELVCFSQDGNAVSSMGGIKLIKEKQEKKLCYK
jgi:glucose uptake protein GlcU